MRYIYLLTLGCPKNLVDSENLSDKLRQRGFRVKAEVSHTPDVIIVNTCGFIEEAKRESINEILRLSKLKRNGTKLIVFGCLVKRYKDELKAEIPEIDALYGVGEENSIVAYIRRYCKASSQISNLKSQIPKPSESYAYIKIAEGCDRACTYCVIPSIRGQFRSYPHDEILRTAESLIKAGKKELILISQDTLSYGRNLVGVRNPYDLNALIRDIASISGDFWIRLLYLNPFLINDRLIETVAETPKVCRYLDIPFQHSEDRLLKAMGRPGSKKWHKELIGRLRQAIPDIALRSTFMVGFPGEKDEEFDALKGFVEEIGFENLGVFKYSKEEGTASAGMKCHISEAIKERRFDELMRLQSKVSLGKNIRLIGKAMKALVDEPGCARIYSQAPEIDGMVNIQPAHGVKTGEFIDIKITSAFDYDLEAGVIK